ncbi:hypothetical protein PVAP13_1KG249225 [Panicum virgatum]|uniref:Uncharacterized protein n=1 Tax=Panicum virgatum TaxID=38727 RepID=A0A8T0XE36_PANVG|nr:hypothetical protein PVAP13_1KG249225 [Panicum virgatum]
MSIISFLHRPGAHPGPQGPLRHLPEKPSADDLRRRVRVRQQGAQLVRGQACGHVHAAPEPAREHQGRGRRRGGAARHHDAAPVLVDPRHVRPHLVLLLPSDESRRDNDTQEGNGQLLPLLGGSAPSAEAGDPGHVLRQLPLPGHRHGAGGGGGGRGHRRPVRNLRGGGGGRGGGGARGGAGQVGRLHGPSQRGSGPRDPVRIRLAKVPCLRHRLWLGPAGQGADRVGGQERRRDAGGGGTRRRWRGGGCLSAGGRW